MKINKNIIFLIVLVACLATALPALAYKEIPAGNTLQPIPASTAPDISHNVNVTNAQRQFDIQNPQSQNTDAATATQAAAQKAASQNNFLLPFSIFVVIICLISLGWLWLRKKEGN